MKIRASMIVRLREEEETAVWKIGGRNRILGLWGEKRGKIQAWKGKKGQKISR